MTDIDITRIQILGHAVTSGQAHVGKKCFLLFRHQDKVDKAKLIQGLQFKVDGPTKPDVMWSAVAHPEVDEFTAVAFFVPVKEGEHKLTVRFNGHKLTQEPFVIEATGPELDIEELLSKVEIHGRARELGEALVYNEFIVDCSRLHPPLGNLKVHVKGPKRASAHLDIVDNENGTFCIRYKPTSPGTYTMWIQIAETDIPHSPFQIRVTDLHQIRTLSD